MSRSRREPDLLADLRERARQALADLPMCLCMVSQQEPERRVLGSFATTVCGRCGRRIVKGALIGVGRIS